MLNRANGREKIFHNKTDYETFEKILFEAKDKYPMRILSFCVMPNHWHFVLYPESEKELSIFMRWITHTHTQRYQVQHKSIGIEKIRYSIKKGRPLGKDGWIKKIAEKLGLTATLKERGRPKKGT